MLESPKWNENHKRQRKLLAEELLGRTAVIANEPRPGGNVISVFQEQSAVQNSKEDWSRGNPIIPLVLSNKNFIIFNFFFPALCWGCLRVIMRFERMLSFWCCRDGKCFINARVGVWKSGTPLSCSACEFSANEATGEQEQSPVPHTPSRMRGNASCWTANKLPALKYVLVCAPLVLGNVCAVEVFIV